MFTASDHNHRSLPLPSSSCRIANGTRADYGFSGEPMNESIDSLGRINETPLSPEQHSRTMGEDEDADDGGTDRGHQDGRVCRYPMRCPREDRSGSRWPWPSIPAPLNSSAVITPAMHSVRMHHSSRPILSAIPATITAVPTSRWTKKLLCPRTPSPRPRKAWQNLRNQERSPVSGFILHPSSLIPPPSSFIPSRRVPRRGTVPFSATIADQRFASVPGRCPRKLGQSPPYSNPNAPAGGICAPPTLPSRVLGRKRGSIEMAAPTLFRELSTVKPALIRNDSPTRVMVKLLADVALAGQVDRWCRTRRPTSGSSSRCRRSVRTLLSMGPSRMRKPTYRLPRGGRVRNAADR